MEAGKPLPILSAPEVRVLGALIEKSKTTPDYYPMTVNALVAACNQKTSRYPVVNYDEETILSALSSLKGQSLVSTAVGGGSRVIKYKHNFTTVYPLSEKELALLCLLFLRGAQTPGELNTNSGRLYEFSSLQSVQEALDQLSTSEPPFVKELAKRPGQKEARYCQLLSEHLQEQEETYDELPHKNKTEERIHELETELSDVKERLEKLEALFRQLND